MWKSSVQCVQCPGEFSEPGFEVSQVPQVFIKSLLLISFQPLSTGGQITGEYHGQPLHIDILTSSPSVQELERVGEAEVVLADVNVVANNLHQFRNCKWIQATFAGVDSLVKTLSSSPPWILTRFVGYFGPAMTNYVFAHLLAREQRLLELAAIQKVKKWRTDDMAG